MIFSIADKHKVINKTLLHYFNSVNRILSKNEQKYLYDVSIVNSREMTGINKQYRNIAKPTDVISFAFHDANKSIKTLLLGEIFINYAMCSNCKKSFNYKMTLLFTHGLLHLLKYDHTNDKSYKKMIAMQFAIMKKVNLLK